MQDFQGRIIEFSTLLTKPVANNNTMTATGAASGRTLLLEPRSVRHQERVNDLFYLLFKRTRA